MRISVAPLPRLALPLPFFFRLSRIRQLFRPNSLHVSAQPNQHRYNLGDQRLGFAEVLIVAQPQLGRDVEDSGALRGRTARDAVEASLLASRELASALCNVQCN